MLEQSILRINEIFWSFQGEGLRVGVPSIFLRLAGCTLKCSYCDTKYAWEQGRWMPLAEILSEIAKQKKKYPASQVVITGGEPLEQDLVDLVGALKSQDYFIAIETSGVEYADLAIDWWTVSPKDVSDYAINKELQKRIDEVKLIVNENLTIDVIKRIRALGDYFTIFLQPDSSDNHKFENTFYLFEQCQLEGLLDIRPGIQLHKVYKVM
ncbi:MAG TPA: 7-carboxy-7-deazaguanine synthase QueE [Candidatus Deferrimicrobium sp.]|nr:7-carboxy-7-deazaguanine synthase QueE [Candidatus Kapabacteria bacterium]HLP60637.1 7-carboxy-7-deazaguanine synthase QueE [Candidatus Deferrimicrobium sp.]